MIFLSHEQIVDLLLKHHMVSKGQIDEAKLTSKIKEKSILDALILSEYVSEEEVQLLVCQTLGIAEEVLSVQETVTANSFNQCPLCDFAIKTAYDKGIWNGYDPVTGQSAHGFLYGARCERCFNHLDALDEDLEAIQSLKKGLKEYKGKIRWQFKPANHH